ncbi:MAG: 2-dehydropantoate 2-reductase [Candidatus Tectomicrobia bacterium]|uniref:2-dehydropantoate 2-reductase n=1 Tax=Tectimicrobiota bacterium TaxID=2528274 RepID=A0A937VZY7_UNCTE|nr:2-dehydropantoate 2-reductase [Candidatus Tectomicrobia bacterium]
MRFVVCGAGAVGSVLGGQLAKAGYAVRFIDKIPEHVEALNTYGLRLKGIHGTHTLSIPAVMHASAVDFCPDDVILLAVKSFHCAAAVAELRQATSLELPVFCAQNGVHNEACVAQSFRQVNGLMVLTGATRLRPGEVIHTGNGPLGVGTYPLGLSQVARDVATAFEATDLPVYTTRQIGPAKWNKLLLNLNNATLGLTGLSTQAVYAEPSTRLWLAAVWEEGVRVLQAAGIAYAGPPGLGSVAERIRELRDPSFTPTMSMDEELQGRSSLWQDLYHRVGDVEAASLNGEIVRLGGQHGIATPYNSLLLTLSQAMATARELPGKYPIAQLWKRVESASLPGAGARARS